MPGNPKGGCQICKAIATAVVSSVKKVKTNFKLYAFISLIFIELFSMKLQNYVSVQDYSYKYYPLLANLEMSIIFLAVYLHSERLRFCTRQKLIVLFLIVYYLINILFLFVPICWSEYYNLVVYSIIGVITLLFIATWKNI